MQIEDPHFWRAGAISIVVVMMIVLVMLTVDSLMAIDAGGSHVPLYSVINQKIGYKFDAARGFDVPTIGEKEPLFGREYSDQDATDLIGKGKLVIQSRACIDCHTFFGNGAYYGPDLTKSVGRTNGGEPGALGGPLSSEGGRRQIRLISLKMAAAALPLLGLVVAEIAFYGLPRG